MKQTGKNVQRRAEPDVRCHRADCGCNILLYSSGMLARLGQVIVTAIALSSAIAWAEPSTPSRLLSLDKIPLGSSEQLVGFQLGTHGITATSLCHKPDGWIVSYGTGDDASGGGVLGGKAKLPKNELAQAQLSALTKMYLFAPTGNPIKLEGIVTVRDKKTGQTRDLPFPSAGFSVEEGTRCEPR